MKIFYTAQAGATSSGREGSITSDDGHLELNLSTPKEMGGGGGEGTNPEQLFAAGYSACFGSALKQVARVQKVTPGDFTIKAKVSIGKTDDDKYGLAVELQGHFPELTPEQGHELMEAAHQVCPYSNATRGNVEVKLSVIE
ncbi:organic hydroperoxide resistance protein [bacterium]|nr:MAG: organic hydroperoxide resistance protein [bacterium]